MNKAINAGYYTRTISESRNSLKSTKILKEEGQYYKAIGIFLASIVTISIVASYLMPTVPL